MLDFIKTCIATIQHAPICEINKRQQRLIDLLAHIVNHETENGQLTSEAGNTALEDMPYWRSLGEYLRDAGFIRLGNGHFSAAYKHSMLPGKVIKVGFKKEDSGAAYVAFCRMHQGLAGIPVIHDVQRHAGCYTVVMDELIELDEAEDLYGGDSTTEYATPDGLYEMAVLGVEGSGVSPMDVFGAEGVAIYETGRKIREFFKGIASFDMHRGNAMWCPKRKALFITDPVSFSRDVNGDCKEACSDWMLDIEVIEAEREEAERISLVRRCQARWRNNERRKEGAQGRACKARRKRAKAHKRQEAAQAVEAYNNKMKVKMAKAHVGSVRFDQVCRVNHWGNIEKFLECNAERCRIDNHGRIFAGMPLACDVELDKRFLG